MLAVDASVAEFRDVRAASASRAAPDTTLVRFRLARLYQTGVAVWRTRQLRRGPLLAGLLLVMRLPRRVPWASLAELEQLCGCIYTDESDVDAKVFAINRVSL